ncbi:hypothetical protein CVT25_013962 [Psilocybe cyanescens]|uniref:Uncharacterized protein n=1 Tax=Psilocybe cyanescens TaxID=93625 RepID=A0A409XJV1_PSICY|nr:hypothetical protein CVT25_013962 [Psilocybe cyanescens]
MACNSTRLRALALYKELHRLGRTTSMAGCAGYSKRLIVRSDSFMSACVENRHLTDKDEIENALKMAEYIKKGVALARSLSRGSADLD